MTGASLEELKVLANIFSNNFEVNKMTINKPDSHMCNVHVISTCK